MKNTLLIGAFIVLSSLISNLAYSQGCVNADFSNNDFTNWTGGTGSCCPINISGTGIVSGRHTIMSGPGTDPNACDDITVVAPGYTYSARLGNPSVGAQAERLSYTYTVAQGSELFTYQYAVVLYDPGSSHSPGEKPRFEISVLNSNGQIISQQCGYYQVAASAQVEGFRNCGNVRYRAWTPVGIDLSAYVGQQVTIQFQTGDCDLGGHYGYAYIVGECNPLEIQVDYCPSNSNVATLTAPAGFSYQWSSGATSRSITIPNPANNSQYSCTLTAVTGCQVTLNATISATAVNTLFSYPPPCPDEPIQFTDLTTSNIGQVVTWEWDFGDNGTSNVANPQHTYTSSGLYNVSLTAITGSGCQATYVETIDVNPIPQAGFAAPTVCDGTPATLTNTTLFPPTIGSWEWDFGDGTSDTQFWDGTHQYDSADVYDVTLIARSHNGQCTDTARGQITVGPLPTADFTFNDVCFGEPVYFTNTSTGGITNSVWDFGDNTYAYEPDPVHDYLSPGNYEVILTVTNPDGCVASDTQTVTVNQVPYSQFSFGNICAGGPVTFTNSSIMYPNNNITDFEWYFGNDPIPNTTDWDPDYTFSPPGTYLVTLITHSPGRACSDTLSDSVRVFAPPVADFNFQNTCLGQPAAFSSISSGDITSWRWDFGDNSAVNYNPSVSHNYDTAQTFDVKLVVTTVYGCSDSTTQTVEVYPSPTASFTAEPVCEQVQTDFITSSTIPPQSTIVRHSWDFADLTPITDGPTVSHTYSNPGNFNVTHYVESAEGCVDSIVQPVIVNPKPVVNFAGEPREGCSPVCVDFRDLSGIMSGSNAEFYWLFGDGNFSPVQNPSHCYKNLSSDSLSPSNVTLTVTSDKGCVNSLRKDHYVEVYPTPGAGFDFAPKITTLVFPTISFYDESVDATKWLWNFGDIQVNNTSELQSPEYTYLDTGTYNITQVVYNDFGCSDSTDVTVIVNPDYTIYIPSAFTPDDNEVNDKFYVTGVGIQEFEIRIFDRWGSMVYFSKDIKQGWDGEVRDVGRTAKQDMYVYTVKILDLLGEEHSYNGKVMLLR